jgi:hypothetical protein
MGLGLGRRRNLSVLLARIRSDFGDGDPERDPLPPVARKNQPPLFAGGETCARELGDRGLL